MAFFEDLLFLGFSVNLILACLLTITAYNAVTALMALIFAFVNATCLFFLMELEFVGLLFIIVYLGAICVLFLFSVMLFNLKEVVRTKTTSFILLNFLIFLGITFLFSILFQFNLEEIIDLSSINSSKVFLKPNLFELNHSNMNSVISTPNSLYFLGQVLYGEYLLYLILVGVVLLVAMLGAVVLINNPKDQTQMQYQLHQISRTIQITKGK